MHLKSRNLKSSLTKLMASLVISAVALTSLPTMSFSVKASTTYYDLWVADNDNATFSEVSSGNKQGKGWKFDPSTNTLTLENYFYSGGGFSPYDYMSEGHSLVGDSPMISGIYYGGQRNLNIKLVGTNKITVGNNSAANEAGLCCWSWNTRYNVNISGPGSLEVVIGQEATSGPAHAIWVEGGELNIQSGVVKASGACEMGINAWRLIIDGGTVIAEANAQGKSYAGIHGNDTVTINGGTVTATAGASELGQSCGIRCGSESIIINGGTVKAKGNDIGVAGFHGTYINGGKVECIGGQSFWSYYVVNRIKGIGWDNVDGTGAGVIIPISESSPPMYKKAIFPYEESNNSQGNSSGDPNGNSQNNNSGDPNNNSQNNNSGDPNNNSQNNNSGDPNGNSQNNNSGNTSDNPSGNAVKATVTVNATGFTGDYDGKSHGITVTATKPESGVAIKYGTTEGTYDLDASPTYTEPGTYTVFYKATAEGYEAATGSATVTINAVATPVGQTVEDNDSIYEVTGADTVAYKAPKGGSKTVTIPSAVKTGGTEYKVTKISDQAFMDNKDVKTVIIPESVTEIGAKAFYKTPNLKNVKIYGQITKCGKKAFYKTNGKCKYTIYAPTKKIYKKIVKKIKKASKNPEKLKFKWKKTSKK